MEVVLYEPEIPPNTGNIARLCAAYDIRLNLVEPLGFKLEDRYLKRAGLDYWPHISLKIWPSWLDFLQFAATMNGYRLVMSTTRASLPVQDFPFQESDMLIFGPETRGLPAIALGASPFHVRIPILNMDAGGVRSLNLSTAVGIVLFTALNKSGLLKRFS